MKKIITERLFFMNKTKPPEKLNKIFEAAFDFFPLFYLSTCSYKKSTLLSFHQRRIEVSGRMVIFRNSPTPFFTFSNVHFSRCISLHLKTSPSDLCLLTFRSRDASGSLRLNAKGTGRKDTQSRPKPLFSSS